MPDADSGQQRGLCRTMKQALEFGGAEEDRTPDLVIANDALSQLSYGPQLLPDGSAILAPRIEWLPWPAHAVSWAMQIL